jgi:uncharacterized protein (DUF1778 family)
MSDNRKRRTDQDYAQLADELEQAMNDPTEWGEPIDEDRPRRSEKRQRAAMISIRLTADELGVVQEAAAARGLSVGRYVRESALRPALPSTLYQFEITLTNETWADTATPAGTIAPEIEVPTVMAPAPTVYYTAPVPQRDCALAE